MLETWRDEVKEVERLRFFFEKKKIEEKRERKKKKNGLSQNKCTREIDSFLVQYIFMYWNIYNWLSY